MRFDKVLHVKAIALGIACLFILNSVAYGSTSSLRQPLLFGPKDTKNQSKTGPYFLPYDARTFYPAFRPINTPTGLILAPRDPDRIVSEEEVRRIVDHARKQGGQVRLMVSDDSMMTYVTGDILTHIMDAAQFRFNIGLATGGTTEALRKLLGLSDMLYNLYGRTIDADKIEKICTLDNYYFTNYLKEKGFSEEEAEKILAISSYESEQLYMMIENMMQGRVKTGLFVSPRGHTTLDWFSETARFRRLLLKYFYVQLWQLHGIGSNSHDAFNEVYMRVQRDVDAAAVELYQDRHAKKFALQDGTDLTQYGMEGLPPFKKIPEAFSNMGMLRPHHASLISFIIQVQNAGYFIPRSFHPFFLKFMADNSLYDVDELISAIICSSEEELCHYTDNKKYHFRDIQHFVDELNFLFKHYSDVPTESITQGTQDLLAMGSHMLPDGNYPLQVFMASAAHKQLAVLRALQSPSDWSTSSVVLNKARAALLVATREALGKVKDIETINTFFIVEAQEPAGRSFSEDSIGGAYYRTPPGKIIQDLLAVRAGSSNL